MIIQNLICQLVLQRSTRGVNDVNWINFFILVRTVCIALKITFFMESHKWELRRMCQKYVLTLYASKEKQCRLGPIHFKCECQLR